MSRITKNNKDVNSQQCAGKMGKNNSEFVLCLDALHLLISIESLALSSMAGPPIAGRCDPVKAP